ncbi:MAG TPA: hypothetical protein ACFCUC_17960 [Desulfobacterales bacterium]
MAEKSKQEMDFFEEVSFDPVTSATGPERKKSNTVGKDKKKAGFYLSKALLERFNRKFYQLKLNGVSIENKSALVEAALNFALDDMDREQDSRVLKNL